MAAAAISIFKISHFWLNFPIVVVPGDIHFKFQPKSSINAEVVSILVNPKWRRPPSWIFKIVHFQIYVVQFIFQLKSSIHTEVINTLVNTR